MNPFGDFEFKEMHEIIKLNDSDISLIGNDICVKSTFKVVLKLRYGINAVRFFTQKNNVSTEINRLVYNKSNGK